MDDLHIFSERLKKLYSHWDSQRLNLWGSSNVLTFATSEQKEQKTKRSIDEKAQRRNTLRLKGSVICKWLFGRVIFKSIFVLMKDQIYCLSSNHEFSFLQLVGPIAKQAVGADFQLYVKSDDDGDGSGLMDVIIRNLNAGALVGHIKLEILKGDVAKLWFRKIKQDRRVQLVDASRGLSELFSVKDRYELFKVRKSASFAAHVMKNVMIPEVDKIIKGKQKISHSSMSVNTLNAIRQLSDVSVVASPPVFQSGECFDLKPLIPCNNKQLKYSPQSIIISSVGTKFEYYNSFIARTFLIDPTDSQRKAYTVLHDAHIAAIFKLKPGNKVSDAYEAAVSCVKEKVPALSAKLLKHAGSGIGLEIHEPELNVHGKNELLVKEGMVFNLFVGFLNIRSDVRGKKFSLWLADTVIVNSAGPEVITAECSKRIEDIILPFVEGGERQPGFMVLDDDDDDHLIVEDMRIDCDSDDFIFEALRIWTQLEAKDKKIKELNSKLEELNAANERNMIANQEDLASITADKEKLAKALKEAELAEQIQSQFDEFDLLFDVVLDS
ncbi:FACT complex subunit SPT16-like [Argentina anserina]|uniref:FACT complex subunit SPT16-like n=1 Tax=Argentina anserina TaxID=57926 RepID=UPI0021762F47|nr:FACT complex subunit SPT16-like [Potentilla anserina]XP_050370122.1 FACT complex subunit SPT16-like [Potentilla anserina]XP_050370123.1 FACT complex subunit SPT16-like [Potentilla anserina]